MACDVLLNPGHTVQHSSYKDWRCYWGFLDKVECKSIRKKKPVNLRLLLRCRRTYRGNWTLCTFQWSSMELSGHGKAWSLYGPETCCEIEKDLPPRGEPFTLRKHHRTGPRHHSQIRQQLLQATPSSPRNLPNRPKHGGRQLNVFTGEVLCTCSRIATEELHNRLWARNCEDGNSFSSYRTARRDSQGLQ